MKTFVHHLIWGVVCCLSMQAQQSISGVVYLNETHNFSGIKVMIEGSNIFTETNKRGQFLLNANLKGELVLRFEKEGYQTVRRSVVFIGESMILDEVVLNLVPKVRGNINRIVLTDDDLLEDGERNDYTAGLFQYANDPYLKAAAYNFSQTWFKLRGIDAAYSTFLVNGIAMNKFESGRPLWSNWGGLNDAFKNQDNVQGLSWSDHSFGGVLGVTSISTRASDYKSYSKISFASTNRSYLGRVMATHASGVREDGWAYVISGSGRYADEGFIDGTPFKSWSAFIAVEKTFDAANSLNFTGFIASNDRGKSSPNTDEVYKLRDYKYNSYWGFQKNQIRNSRMKKINEPVLMLSYYHEGETSNLKASVSYQFGSIKNSRLGYFKAENPDPTYYKKLPSYYLRDVENPDYANAYLAANELQSNGQVNWLDLYEANYLNEESVYYLYDDVVASRNFGVSISYDRSFGASKRWVSGMQLRNVSSENFAEMTDLLGGNYFTDLNQYGEGEGVQNDLNNPNREVFENDRFQYNYSLNSREFKIFTQFEQIQNKYEYFFGLEGVSFNSQREGYYKNGSYVNNSFGSSKAISLSGLSVKGGGTYKVNGKHLITMNAGFLSRIPPLQSLYANQRVSNKIIPNIQVESLLCGDLTYRFRSSKFQGRVSGYLIDFKKGIETSFFFAQGLFGDQADFIHEIVTNVERRNVGVEWSAKYQISDKMNVFGAGTFAQYKYTNNPNLQIESESFPLEETDFGKTYLKNIRQGNTPQSAFSLGFEYRDNDFWWFQANLNYLSNNYLDVTPLLRTDNFYLDENGVPFIDVDTGKEVTANQVQELLQQEVFEPVFLINLVGGKSWKVQESYVGFFMVVNNVLGTVFRSGGFEQARKANYPELKQDKSLETPLFGSKYWYGSGTSYYFSMYYRF